MIVNPIVAAAAVAASRAARAVSTILPRDWMGRERPSNFSRPESSFREAFPSNPYFMDMEDNQYYSQREENPYFDMEENRYPADPYQENQYYADMHAHAREMEENQYFAEMEENQYFAEENMHAQARELEDFMSRTPKITKTPPINIKDAEILSKEQTIKPPQSSKNPPPLPNTNNPLRLLGLEPGADYDAIRRAYKERVKLYHPDVVVGPDASEDERQAANWEFARINAAFDILKRKENEEVLEYTIFVDGEHVTRTVDVSEDSRRHDPYRINYDRIKEMNKRRPNERMWYEEDRDYQQRHNGFEVDRANTDPYSRGKWWNEMHMFEHERGDTDFTPGQNGFGPIPSRESMWEGMHNIKQEHVEQDSGFGFNSQDRSLNERQAFGYGNPRNSNHEYQPKEGHPYKDTLWNERPSFDGIVSEQPISDNDFEYDPQEHFPLKEKWWREDEGGFGP
ncbi:hypothetical protein ACHAXR_008134 [Thalassiosira sp. AJA248-18]